jgi:hypothetical protein
MPPLHINLVEPDYMVAALDDDFHSLFGGEEAPKKGRSKKESEEIKQDGNCP